MKINTHANPTQHCLTLTLSGHITPGLYSLDNDYRHIFKDIFCVYFVKQMFDKTGPDTKHTVQNKKYTDYYRVHGGVG